MNILGKDLSIKPGDIIKVKVPTSRDNAYMNVVYYIIPKGGLTFYDAAKNKPIPITNVRDFEHFNDEVEVLEIKRPTGYRRIYDINWDKED